MKKIGLILVSLLVFSLAACQLDQQEPVPGSPSQADNLVLLEVAPFWQPCVGVSPMLCYQVREEGQQDWTYFYDQINGFTYEPGYLYQLSVQKESSPHAPADASTIVWTLVEEISKSPVEMPQIDLAGTSWKLTSMQGNPLVQESQITLEFTEPGQLGGNAGCNQYFASYELHGVEFSITGPIGSTMMACEEVFMNQESDFLQTLEQMQYFQLSENTLLLVSADGLFLSFEK